MGRQGRFGDAVDQALGAGCGAAGHDDEELLAAPAAHGVDVAQDLDGQAGKDVAQSLGLSEPTISRRLAKVRILLRDRLATTIATYSFTQDEIEEARRNGLLPAPNNAGGEGAGGDELFDESIAEIYHRQLELRRQDQTASLE